MKDAILAIGILTLCSCGQSTQPTTDLRLVGQWVPHSYITARGSDQTLNPIMQLFENGDFWEAGEYAGSWEVTGSREIPDGEAIEVTITLMDGAVYAVSFFVVEETRLRILDNTSTRGPVGVYFRDGELGGQGF